MWGYATVKWGYATACGVRLRTPLTTAYLNPAITDPKEAVTYPACGSVLHLTVAYPHMTVLQITALTYHNSYCRRTECEHEVSHYFTIGKNILLSVIICLTIAFNFDEGNN